MLPTTSATRSNGMRASMYLLRLDWHLEGVVPSSERKHILEALREAIDTDSRPLQVVLADLGSPRVLAQRYSEGGWTGPLWSVGILCAASALIVYWIVFLSFAGGILAAVSSAAPMSADATFLFVPVMAFSDDEGFGIGWSSGWEWLVVPGVIVTLAFLLGARMWRLVRRREVLYQRFR